MLAVSIVSHGHAFHVRALLVLLAQSKGSFVQRVWLTLNLPEPDLEDLVFSDWPFELHLLINPVPLGFGVNHNKAFQNERSLCEAARWFAVLNPDLFWTTDPFPALMAAVEQPGVGFVYPLQLDLQGRVQDHRRVLPTPGALLRRHVSDSKLDSVVQTDWVNAAFLVFPAPVYAAVSGFDPRYFMYCEDVDLSLRLQLAGYRLVEVPQARVVHVAHRSSRRNLRHLVWHLSGLWRLWHSVPYRQFQICQSIGAIEG